MVSSGFASCWQGFKSLRSPLDVLSVVELVVGFLTAGKMARSRQGDSIGLDPFV